MSNNTTRGLTLLYPWIIWVIGAGFFFYKYLIQVSPSVMTNDLMKAFQINGAGLGNLSAFYFYAYLLMQIPVGILLDRYSPKLLTAMAILLCAISTFIFSQSDTLWLACLSRALMGTGAAFAAVSCFKLSSVWFPPKRFALMSGMCMTVAMLGAVSGQAPLSMLVQAFDWRSALQMISLIGILLGIFYLCIVRDKKEKSTPRDDSTLRYRFISIIRNKQAWLLSFYSGLAFAPVSVFGGLWGVPFLETAHRLSPTHAALAISWIFIGFAFGAPFFGWLSDFIGRRKPVLFAGPLIALICLSIVLYVPQQSLFILSVFLFFFGFGASGFFTSFAMIREIFSVALVATVLGFMNTFDSICEALSEPLVGAFLDFTWNGNTLENVHQFSTQGYQIALLILPLYLLIAILLLFLIKETYCRMQDK